MDQDGAQLAHGQWTCPYLISLQKGKEKEKGAAQVAYIIFMCAPSHNVKVNNRKLIQIWIEFAHEKATRPWIKGTLNRVCVCVCVFIGEILVENMSLDIWCCQPVSPPQVVLFCLPPSTFELSLDG